MTTILLTGIPRSGTNLVCACLNTLPNCVALTEPMMVPRHGDADRAVSEILSFAEATRQRLLSDGVAPSRTVKGVIADNFFPETGDGGLRSGLHDPGVTDVVIGKLLPTNFRLFIKHPAIFTALATRLLDRIPLYAVVRHPLAILASWNTVDMDARLGRWPVAEIYAAELRDRLERSDGALGRQIELLRWHFDVYRQLPRENILTYESIALDPTTALRALSDTEAAINHQVRAFDLRNRYAGVDLSALAAALLTIRTEVETFYPNVEESLRPYIGSASQVPAGATQAIG